MFDYYALPNDWPGRKEATEKVWSERAGHVEKSIHTDIVTAMGGGFDPKHFIPYVELHEFEALVFADVKCLAAALAPIGGGKTEETLIEELDAILNEAGHPEAIDDGYETCPSRRIGSIVSAYRKRVLGPTITKRIGVDVLRKRCTHFGEWLARLEQLGVGG